MCSARLQRNLKKLSLPWPDFLPATADGVAQRALGSAEL